MNRTALSRAAMVARLLLAIAAIAPLAAVRAQESAPLPDVSAAIKTATAQHDYEMLDRAAAEFEAAHRYTEAERLLKAALPIRGQTAGERSGIYAAGLVNLGDLARKFEKRGKADGYYTSAVTRGDRPEVAGALLYLGIEAYARKIPVLAAELINRAYKVNREKSLNGPLFTWAAVFQQGVQAQALYRQALAVEDPNSPDAALTMETYAHFLPGAADASEMTADASAIRKSHIMAETPKRTATTPAVKAHEGDSAPPNIVYKVEPVYSAEASALQIQGTAVLSVVIDRDGKPYDAQLVRSLGFGLDEAALTAITRWRFKPGTRNGAPVPVRATIQVRFKLL